MNFNIRNDSVFYYGAVESYNATWRRLDSQASMVNGNVNPHAGGRLCLGAGTLAATSENWNKATPTSGTTYTYTPWWQGKYVRISATLGNGQNVYSTLTWKRGTATYYLNAQYVIPDNAGWPRVGGC